MPYTTINKPNTQFNTVLWTGNGGTQTITGVGFQPSLVWGKSRSVNYEQSWIDFVRGGTKYLFSNGNSAESTDANAITSFNADGFSIGSSPYIGNANGATYVGWNWLASNSTTSNTSGAISSTVSSNTTNGFSIFTYTGTGASITTVGHGCSSEPKFVIVKNRSGTGAWVTYHYGAGATGLGNPNQASLILNGTNASANPASGGYLSDGYFSNVNSTTITLRDVNNANNVNATGNNYVGYAFAEVKGFSKFGSYTGNGSTDGTFVYTGFKPAYIMIKVTSTTDDWNILDNKRDPENTGSELILYADLNNTEGAAVRGDFLSNGFKCRTTNVSVNSAGATYVYIAFAENPFVSSTQIPTTAR
jgi:hypothetical protein